MSNLYKTSAAQIIRAPGTTQIRIVEYANPEVLLPKMIQNYFLELGYSSMYPNFSTLRVGAIHPFALLLFQDVSGQPLDLSVFPSITVSDTSDSEVYDELGHGHVEMMLGAEDIEKMIGARTAGYLLMSDSAVTRLRAATAAGRKVLGIQGKYRANHNIDLNIWADNKDLVGMLYDMLKQFAISHHETLHLQGIDLLSPLTGRRSGDINVEFGKLLYGANITMPAVIETANMEIDTPLEAIEHIIPQPDYHVEGEAESWAEKGAEIAATETPLGIQVLLDAEGNETHPWQFDDATVSTGNALSVSTYWKTWGNKSYKFEHISGAQDTVYAWKEFNPASDHYILEFDLNMADFRVPVGGWLTILDMMDVDWMEYNLGVDLVRFSDGWGIDVAVNDWNDYPIDETDHTVLLDDKVYHVKIEWRRHATLGGAALWLNGTLIGSNFAFDTQTSSKAARYIEIGNTWTDQNPTVPCAFYIDEFKLFNLEPVEIIPILVVLDGETDAPAPYQFDYLVQDALNTLTKSIVWSEDYWSYRIDHASGAVNPTYGVKAFPHPANHFTLEHVFHSGTWSCTKLNSFKIDDANGNEVLTLDIVKVAGGWGVSLWVNNHTLKLIDQEATAVMLDNQPNPVIIEFVRDATVGGASLNVRGVDLGSSFTNNTATATGPADRIFMGLVSSVGAVANGSFFYVESTRINAVGGYANFPILLRAANAEDGGVSPWQFDSVTQDAGNEIIESTDWKAAGLRSYRFKHVSGGLLNNYATMAIRPTDHIVWEFFLNTGTWDDQQTGPLELLDATSNTVLRFLIHKVAGGWGVSLEINNWTDTIFDFATTNLFPSATKTKIRIEYKRHSTRGGAALWINDALIASDFTYNTSTWNGPPSSVKIGCCSTWGTPSVGAYFYIDEFQIDALLPDAFVPLLVSLDAEDFGSAPFQFDSVQVDAGWEMEEPWPSEWVYRGYGAYKFKHVSGVTTNCWGLKTFIPTESVYVDFVFNPDTFNSSTLVPIRIEAATGEGAMILTLYKVTGGWGYVVRADDGNITLFSRMTTKMIDDGVATKIRIWFRRNATVGGGAIWINGVQTDSSFIWNTTIMTPIPSQVRAGMILFGTQPSDGVQFYLDNIVVESGL